MNQFRHKPINLEGYSIRLLRLCKADFGNVQCELIHAYLDDKNIMEYEALSYTWGGSYKAHDVEVDGGMMAVTQNLSLALRSLRKSNEDRILWVDAICIDQENDKEKGHQVSQMGSIFAKAAQVLIWLGPATPETNLVFREISRFEGKVARREIKDSDIFDEQRQGLLSSLHISDGKWEISLTPDQKEGLNDLLSRPWFERVWIIQEVANAKRARVVCGAESVLARTFALFSFLSEISPSQNCQAILDVMPGPTREYSWWTENHDLNTLLLKFRGSQASEPRDKICALLGISSDRATKGFPVPNYTKSEVEVVQDTVAFLLQLPTGMEGSAYSPAWTPAEFMQRLISLAHETCVQAAGDGSLSTVKFLLATGKAGSNFVSMEGHTPLLRAAGEGHESIVELLLGTDDMTLNFPDREGETPLLRAAEKGHESVAKLLLRTGKVEIDARNNNGQTPLLQAAKSGHESVVQLLLDTGKIDVNSTNSKRETPLLLAAKNGHDRIVRLLVERYKARINVTDMYGHSPLLVSSRRGNLAAFKHILDTGAADFELRDSNGWCPLSIAAISGHEAIVNELLQTKDRTSSTSTRKAVLEKERKLAFELVQTYKANGNSQKDCFSEPPLAWMIRNGYMELFQLFLETTPVDIGSTYIRADTAARIEIGGYMWNPRRIPLILWAALNRPRSAVVALLGAMKTECCSSSKWAESLLNWALKEGDGTIVRLLLSKHRADELSLERLDYIGPEVAKGCLAMVDLLLDSGASGKWKEAFALSSAVREGRLSIVRRFLITDNVATYLNLLYSRQIQLLWNPAMAGNTDMVKLLLEAPGIKVDSRNERYQQTPLSIAAEMGHADIVKLLLETNSVDLGSRDTVGRTPLGYAKQGGYTEVVALLTKHSKHPTRSEPANSSTEQTTGKVSASLSIFNFSREAVDRLTSLFWR